MAESCLRIFFYNILPEGNIVVNLALHPSRTLLEGYAVHQDQSNDFEGRK